MIPPLGRTIPDCESDERSRAVVSALAKDRPDLFATIHPRTEIPGEILARIGGEFQRFIEVGSE